MIAHQQRDGSLVTCNALVTAILAGGCFRVMLDDGHLATCRPSGRMQLGRINIAVGDGVVCEFAAGSFEKGRITFKFDGDGLVLKPRHRRKWRGGRARQFDEQIYKGDVA